MTWGLWERILISSEISRDKNGRTESWRATSIFALIDKPQCAAQNENPASSEEETGLHTIGVLACVIYGVMPQSVCFCPLPSRCPNALWAY